MEDRRKLIEEILLDTIGICNSKTIDKIELLLNYNMYDRLYEVWDAARLVNPIAGMKYDTFEDYLKSL